MFNQLITKGYTKFVICKDRNQVIKKLIDMEKPSGNVYRDVATLVKNRKLENTNGWYTVVPDIPD